MGRRRRRPCSNDDSDVDMTSYDDVTRSSALLAYVKLSAADSQLGISVVGYLGCTRGGLYISQVHGASASSQILQLGDRINSINGFRLGHLDNDDAFRLLQATVSRQMGTAHTVRLGIIRSRDVGVLRHWQRLTGESESNNSRGRPTTTTTTTTTATTTTTSNTTTSPQLTSNINRNTTCKYCIDRLRYDMM